MNGVLTVVLAPTCAACDRVLETPLDGPVCAACWSGIVRLHQPLTEASRAAGEYEGSLREIIHAFKYDGRQSLAGPLARLMHEAGADLLRDADFVVPVPLHPWRRLQRGFNQAEELARRLDMPVRSALWRVRATVPQTELDIAQRRRNVRGAFRLSPFVRRSRLEGARIVLIDDVRTTGATLDACARVLRDAGAREIQVLTVAQARVTRSR
ncbi:MAG: ComF family protein [Steroidobacteraceae bacterium]